MLRTWVIVGIALVASSGPTLAQDAATGEQVFKRSCSPCHEIGQNAKIKVGPPLNGIDGRKSGTFDGFNYSPANKSSGITWSEGTFHKYIRAPMQEMPGTRMAFVGIKNDKDIADLWTYLKQNGPDGGMKTKKLARVVIRTAKRQRSYLANHAISSASRNDGDAERPTAWLGM